MYTGDIWGPISVDVLSDIWAGSETHFRARMHILIIQTSVLGKISNF